MQLPRRSVKSIQPLPSIYTTFSVNNEGHNTSEHSGKCLIRPIEDGIEVVPIERCNVLSAPILSPDTAEKELFIIPEEESGHSEKPLPRLPESYWARLSMKQRVLALLAVQIAMVLTIGLSLMAARNHASLSGLNVRTDTTGDNSSKTTEATSSIARGPFAVPIQLPQQQSSACLAKTNESAAWQCASDTTFQFNVLPPPMDSNTTMITLGSMPDINGTIYHGHQAPSVLPTELKLITAGDSSEHDRAVYHFRSTYNRIVLLKDSDFLSVDQPRSQPIMRHPTFQNGESLWRCTFNETVIEGYIYPDQKTATATSFNVTTMTVKDLPKIPYVLKLVEQRMPNGKEPYCEKMKVQDGKLVSLVGEDIMLSLTEPEAEAQAAARVGSARFRARQQAAENSYCRCQWMVQ